jgi:hypothetical protein
MVETKADLAYECPNTGPHNPHLWPQGFCPGVEAPEPVLCAGSGRSWVWDKGAAVCQKCHEPATWMGLRPPRRKEGAFRTKVPPHVNRMPGVHTFSQKAQIEILKDELDVLRGHIFSAVWEMRTAATEISIMATAQARTRLHLTCDTLDELLDGYAEPVEADNKS